EIGPPVADEQQLHHRVSPPIAGPILVAAAGPCRLTDPLDVVVAPVTEDVPALVVPPRQRLRVLRLQPGIALLIGAGEPAVDQRAQMPGAVGRARVKRASRAPDHAR